MRRVIGVMVISAVALMSGCGNTYDDEIDKVISLENVEMKDAKKDIDKVERSKTCTKVYRDGKLIELEYGIRKNGNATRYYKKTKDEYKWISTMEAKNMLKQDENPVYQENCE